MKSIELYLVRHGETIFNLLSKMQWWADSPLTEKGISDLEITAQRLSNTHFDALYSSDLKRAMDTAEIIRSANTTSDLVLRPSKNLREIFFGSFEGIYNIATWEEIASDYGYKTQQELIDHYSIDFVRDAMKKKDPKHYAEDSSELWNRMANAKAQLLAENESGSRVLVVTHGTLIKTLAYKYSDVEKPEFPDNGSVTKAILSDNEFKITDYNTISD